MNDFIQYLILQLIVLVVLAGYAYIMARVYKQIHYRRIRSGFEICLGDPMWVCRNGYQNYRYHLDLGFHHTNDWTMGGAFHIPHRVALTPFLSFAPWHKSVLASNTTIGNTYKALDFEIEWLGFGLCIRFGFNVNTKKELPPL